MLQIFSTEAYVYNVYRSSATTQLNTDSKLHKFSIKIKNYNQQHDDI